MNLNAITKIVRQTVRHIACYWWLASSLFVAGCVSGGRLPADLAHVRLELVDSPVVRVSRAWLDRSNGQLLLRGHVLRRLEANDTTSTHLDVSLLDQSGTLLHSTREYFQPRQIRRRHRRPDSADFNIKLENWTPQTRTIVIRAHEGDDA